MPLTPGRLSMLLAALGLAVSIAGRLRSGTTSSRGLASAPAGRDVRWLLLAEALTLSALLWQGRRHGRVATELHDSESSLRQAVQAVGLGMWSCRAGDPELQANALLRAELGLPEGTRCTFADFLASVHPDDRHHLQAAVAQAWRDGHPVDIEHRLAGDGASTRWAVTRANAERDAGGRIVRLRGIRMSISPRKDAELDAEQARKQLAHLMRVGMLGQLSGSLAHELNQPLTAILANAQAALRFLKRDPVDHREVVAILEDIVADDKRAGEVIRRLRALFVRGEARVDRVDLNDVVHAATALVHSDLIARNITVVKALASDLPALAGDRVQLEQLLLNLVLNATDAMADTPPALRKLTIRTEVQDGMALLSIIDRGKGIPADQMDNIFQPFVTTKDVGIGLGLAISRKIALAHHGQLWAEGNEFGGATLKLALPLASDAPLRLQKQPWTKEPA